MRRRMIHNIQKVLREICKHNLWELEPLLPEKISSQIRLIKQTRHFAKNHYFLCPFHEEKTASLWYTPENGTIYCFGCGLNFQNLIVFYMKLTGQDFYPSVIKLARFFGIKLKWKNNFLEGTEAKEEKENRRMKRFLRR